MVETMYDKWRIIPVGIEPECICSVKAPVNEVVEVGDRDLELGAAQGDVVVAYAECDRLIVTPRGTMATGRRGKSASDIVALITMFVGRRDY